MSLMIVQYGRVVVSSSNYNNKNSSNSKHKGDIINVAKVAAKKSILMQITARAKAASGFH
jgi:ribosomal protein S17